MNTLYLTYDGLTDPLGQSQVLPYMIGLSENDVNITIISFEKANPYKKQHQLITQITKQNSISWIPLKYTKQPPFISTIYDIYNLKKTVKQLLKKNQISLIHCRSYITALIGLWAKKKYNIPFLFDMRGFWADERVDGKIWNIEKWMHKKAYNYFKKKELEFLQAAAHTISLTQCGKEEISSWKLPSMAPITVIPCCTDEELFNLKNVDNLKADLGIQENDFVISYLGSIGTWYMLDEMLDFFKELLLHKKDAKFLFITKDDETIIKKRAYEKGITENQLIVKPSDRKDVPSFLKASDVSIFFIKPLYSKKASSPTKMGEIMNLEIPIICNSGVGDVDIIMNETMPELLINEFSTKEYNRAIKNLLESNIDNEKMKLVSKKYFSLKNGINNCFSVYQQINKSNK